MSEATAILNYRSAADAGPRPWCRNAVKALAWVVACPVLSAGPLMYAADNNWLPPHFLCCRHPEVTFLVFAGMPIIGVLWGWAALAQIIRDPRRPRPRGIVVASLAIVTGLAAGFMGVIVGFALQA